MVTVIGTVMCLTRRSVEMILVGGYSSFSVFLYCGPSYICSSDLHLCCWSIPSSRGDCVTVMSFLNKLGKKSQMLARVFRLSCLFIYVHYFSPVISSCDWSDFCFEADVLLLEPLSCLPLDYDVLQHTHTHTHSTFPIQIDEYCSLVILISSSSRVHSSYNRGQYDSLKP